MIPVLTIRKSLKSWKGVSFLIWKDLTGSLVTSPVFWQRSSQNYTKRIRKRYHGIPLDFSQILLTIPRFSSSLSYMVSFVFLFSSFVSLAFFCLCVFFESKNICFDTHSTLRAGKWKKIFTRPISGNKTTFFLT